MFSIINFYHLQNDLVIYVTSTLLTFFTFIILHLAIFVLIIIIKKKDEANALETKWF